MPIMTLLIRRFRGGLLRTDAPVTRIRNSNILRADDDIRMAPGDDRVLVRAGWILRPLWRNRIEEPIHAAHPDLMNATRAIANAIADVQSGFVQRIGRTDRFQLLFGKTMTEEQILEMCGKSRAQLARHTKILGSMDDWLQALWEERETALAAVQSIYESAIALHEGQSQWSLVQGLWKAHLPDLACAPFDAFANAVQAEISAIGEAEPISEDKQRMAEALAAEADAIRASQMVEDIDVRLSRVESCLRRAPERRRTEALENLAGAEILLGAYREACKRYTTSGRGRRSFHGSRYHLEITRRAIEKRNFSRALHRLEVARARLALLMNRAY